MTHHIRVVLTGKHPHAGESGHIEIKDGKIEMIAPLGIGAPDMVLVKLDNCEHGTDACYAKQSDMRLERRQREVIE